MPVVFLDAGARPVFPDDLEPELDGLVALGGELRPDVVLEAYRKGIFPWTGKAPIPWYSPDPRLLLFPAEVHVSRSLAKALRSNRFEVRENERFTEVMKRCAAASRPDQHGTWITRNMIEVYSELHRAGFGRSVEVLEEKKLVGGLYGLAIGRAFFGESMFAAVPNASKIALVHLCRALEAEGCAFIDCQQVTPHLVRMGAVPISRATYLSLLARALC